MYTRIVVPLDGSELAQWALPEASAIARLSQAPLHLVRIVDLTQLDRYGLHALDGRAAAVQHLIADEVAQATADLERTAAQLRAQGLSVTTEVRQGGVIFELQQVARPGDLYVIASHGRGGVVRWLLGSVAEELVRRSLVPVLFVRVLVPRPVPARAPASATASLAVAG